MTYDTHTITVSQDDFSFPDNNEFNWTEEHVIFLVNYAVSNFDMELDTPMNFKNYGVTEIVKGIIYSKVAYIESQVGYFIISEDMMLHINITYSRWD
ncbi:MAG: hypothetical protein PHO65_08390 [Sulfurovum sp.]|nr:hypothetical protein [Sulfurovum sp.]